MSTLDAVLRRIDQDLDQSVARLFALLRIASVSTDPAYKEQCRTAAERVAADLRSIGFAADVRPTEGHQVLVGKSNGDCASASFLLASTTFSRLIPSASGTRRRSNRASKLWLTGAKSSSRAVPATTKEGR